MRAALALAACLLTPLLSPAAAGAIGVTPSIAVGADLSACASLWFDRPVTATGAFAAAGAVNGPGTITMPIAGVKPVLVAGGTGWRACIPGAYAGATAGVATYTLVVDVGDGAFGTTLTCRVRNGVVTCQ